MKLDPKYFNLFVTVCAVVTVVAILYGSIRYHQGQEKTFRENIEQKDLGDFGFPSYMPQAESLRLSSYQGEAVVVDFWATWSARSKNVHHLLHEMMKDPRGLTVLAAAVRDDEALIRDYIQREPYPFVYVDGTRLYQDLQVPGVPSQILIDSAGNFFDMQIGEDREALKDKIEALIRFSTDVGSHSRR